MTRHVGGGIRVRRTADDSGSGVTPGWRGAAPHAAMAGFLSPWR